MTAIPPDLRDRIVALRRDLHRHPEVSWSEVRTAERIEAELADLGLTPRRVCETGVIADLGGDRPRVALRADTDALPVHEATGLPFASERPGAMHACGHDGHTAMAVGAAALLMGHPPVGGVRLIFQPAEEAGSGALAMVDAGALDGVAMIFGGHLDNRYEAGTLVIHEGAVNASTDGFTVRVIGRGGHGARPHEAVDPVVVAAHIVVGLQSVVGREVDPGAAAVVSVGSIHGGSAQNVLASEVELSGTLRAQAPEVRRLLQDSVRRVAEGVAAAHRARVEVAFQQGSPAVINQGSAVALAREAAREVVGEDRVRALRAANMGGEDFSVYLEHIEGFYARFGGRLADGSSPPAHSGGFDFHEDALGVGAAWMARVARRAAEWLARERP